MAVDQGREALVVRRGGQPASDPVRGHSQNYPSFGRVYAAYGGIFIVLALLWGWWIDKNTPDVYDWIGAALCMAGVSVILWAPRH